MMLKLFQLLFIIFLFFCVKIKAETKILIFGDFGMGNDNQKIVARDMEDFCDKKGCDFAVTVGDNIYPKGVGNDNFNQPNYKIITDYFVNNYKSMNMPFYMAFGNHDIGNEKLEKEHKISDKLATLMSNQIKYTKHSDNPSVIDRNKNSLRLWYFPAPYYYIKEKDGVNLFALDTNSFPDRILDEDLQKTKRRYNSEQSKWLNQSLGEIKNNKNSWKLVFGHMPIISHGAHGFLEAKEIKIFRESLIKLLCSEKVDFYLSGHDHHLEVDRYTCDNGHTITSVISGAASQTARIFSQTFANDSNNSKLIWANGKLYDPDSTVFRNNDRVLGFAYLTIDGAQAQLRMQLSKGASDERQNGCFEINKDGSFLTVKCSD